jgi:hypothetical protein
MSKNINLLTLADGFGDSNVAPPWYPNYFKWPEIIKLMTRNVELHNLSRYGAGNEYIIQCLRSNLINKQAVIIQWAIPNRLDLILAHNSEQSIFWNQQIAEDQLYNNNVVSINNERVWITSGSQNLAIKEYHRKFISLRQHQIRSQLYIDYATLLLKDLQYGFMLTKDSEYLSQSTTNTHQWMWHCPWRGMCEFRKQSNYAELELGITQPIPLVHFDFIRQFIQPKFDLPWRNEREIQAVENMLYRKYQEALKNKPI